MGEIILYYIEGLDLITWVLSQLWPEGMTLEAMTMKEGSEKCDVAAFEDGERGHKPRNAGSL